MLVGLALAAFMVKVTAIGVLVVLAIILCLILIWRFGVRRG